MLSRESARNSEALPASRIITYPPSSRPLHADALVRAPDPDLGDIGLADPLDASVGGLAGRLARLLFGSAFSRAAVSVTVRGRPTTPVCARSLCTIVTRVISFYAQL